MINMEIKLSKEIEFEGKKYAELAIDLDELTGRDLVDAGVEASGITGRPVTDIDKTYQTCVAAKAAKVPPRHALHTAREGLCEDNFAGTEFFAERLGEEPCQSVREICCSLSRATYTPLPFWLDMRPREWEAWIKALEKTEKN